MRKTSCDVLSGPGKFLARFWAHEFAKGFAEDDQAECFLREVLRAVGQGLESLDIENFELQVEGDGYLAVGTPRAPSPGAVANRSTQRGIKVTFQNAWHIIAHRISHHNAVDSTSNILRVLFTPEGIRRLECEGETKRSEDSAGIAF